jgi:ATP-dependent phosphoenolpyruvate carboxykinase
MVDLSKLGITTSKVHANLSNEALINLALETDKSSVLSDTGALIVYSGEKTGRSPKDKRIVLEEGSKENINWGEVNQPIDPSSFEQAKANAIDFFNTCDELFTPLELIIELVYENEISHMLKEFKQKYGNDYVSTSSSSNELNNS